ncbi:MAG: DNA repair protein RecN [Bacteroidetes bacterium]|nr:DNA repair protein RecN [Bacteroidota bacterium]MBS1739409.1 DNA repair protein RecN [Bacteroidota bacterium]
MLQKLAIRNYAIIDNLTIEPNAEFNIVTGETGAGKSIILGALSLILGERADSSVLINKNEKCVVEAYFDVDQNVRFQKALAEEDIDSESPCIIRREISTTGKSRAFINDTPVTLNILNKLTALLVDLHQQFGHLAIEGDDFQTNIVDAIAENAEERKNYSQSFQQFKQLEAELKIRITEQQSLQKDSDYKQFLFDELLHSNFKKNEIEETETHLKQMAHGEKLIQVLTLSNAMLEDSEQPIISEVRKLTQQLQSISDILPEISPIIERLHSVHAELKDIHTELKSLEESISIDPIHMQQLQERLDLGYRLLKKHGVQTTSALLEIQTDLENDLSATENLDKQIEEIKSAKESAFLSVKKLGEKLSHKRKKAVPLISKKVTELLHLVGMPNALFRIDVSDVEYPNEFGLNSIQFMLDANKSGQFQPVHKAASGGEMSRIMLCIKSLTAAAMELPTLIFDEVDTGISGEAARQVANLLQSLGSHHQIICITHQPQVAAKGSRHFFVYKTSLNGKVVTQIRVLQPEERITAIAQMIGGEKPSEAALQNARELVS